MRLFTCLVLLVAAQAACASPYDAMIDSAAIRHGIDPIVLRAITEQETGKKPWSFNVDGEGFTFADKNTAIGALWSLTKSPWMAKIRPLKGNGKTVRRFFTNQHAAQSFVNGFQHMQMVGGKATLKQVTDNGKSVSFGEARVRRLWLVNTDIGIAQINYRFHGKDLASVQQWFDPGFNLNYAATLLAKHKRKHGTDIEAAGYYHSATEKYRAKYLHSFMPIYRKEKARAGVEIASN